MLSETITVGTGGGSSSFEWTTGAESTINTESSRGLHYSMSIVGGAVFKAGAYNELDYSVGTGSFSSKGVSTTTGGTVIDLDAAGGPAASSRYGFDWRFGRWNIDLGVDGSVPVYGYMISNIKAPSPAVDDLMIKSFSSSQNEYTLGWTKPDVTGRADISGYNAYVKSGDTYTKLNTSSLITGTEFTFVYEGSYANTFVVTSISVSNVESTYSNETMFFKSMAGKSAYEIACDNGFTGTESEWLLSLVGSSAYESARELGYKGSLVEWLNSLKGETGGDGASAYEVAVSNGYSGNVDDWLQSLIGAQGPKGDKGDKGDTGAQGPQGLQGVQGEKGDTGAQGAQGLQGIQGEKGDTGAQGPQGLQGIQGEKGDTGAQGAQGLQGIQGEKGDNGAQGAQGLQGIQGEKGDTGAQGAQGLQGIQGEKGDTGAQGAQGVQGIAGEKGESGTGISGVAINPDGSLIVTLSDGNVINAGTINIEGFEQKISEQENVIAQQKDDIKSAQTAAVAGAGVAGVSLLGTAFMFASSVVKKKLR